VPQTEVTAYHFAFSARLSRRSLAQLVHKTGGNVAMTVDLDTGRLEPDPGGIRNAPPPRQRLSLPSIFAHQMGARTVRLTSSLRIGRSH
jgi:hypothetical protein